MTLFPPAPSRRSVMGAIVALGTVPARLMAQQAQTIIAGTYTDEGGRGLVQLAARRDAWVPGRTFPAIANASFGVRSAATGLRYIVDERTEGALGIHAPDLRRIRAVATGGAAPCHVALRPDGGALAVANYMSGSVALWRLDRRTGLPVGDAQVIAHHGSGPDRARQAGPHAHWVGFLPGRPVLHAVDLGADAIFAHRYDPRSDRPVETVTAYRAPAGSGPRHIVRHPRLPFAFLVSELANTVTVLRAQPDATFSASGTVSTLPAGFRGASAAAHIAINQAGDRLYVSNRGHDSIAVFAIGRDAGLTPIQHVACGGHWPRLFLLLEDRGEMLVANERSGDVASLRIGKGGMLQPLSGRVAVPGVAYLAR
jgi:6-phosphogluconolactonase